MGCDSLALIYFVNPIYARYAPTKNTKIKRGAMADRIFLNLSNQRVTREGKSTLPTPRTKRTQPINVITPRKSNVQIL